jgi:YesN/AraC family two-component response regulator
MPKILLIEDDRFNRNLFQECLETEGFNTISAKDGLSGIEQAKECLPDLILCDIVIPALNGYEVLSQLRKDPKTALIPFIFLTARAAKSERRQGMELGADDYLIKPLTVDELLAAVSARLERQAMLKRCFASEVRQEQKSEKINVTEQTSINDSIFPDISELSEVFEFIEANYHREIALTDVAQAIGYSPAYLTNRVKHETGKTVNGWIIERRMTAARSLLLETDWSVEQVAASVGYLNVSYFFRQFRQYQGTTPKAWRENQKRDRS